MGWWGPRRRGAGRGRRAHGSRNGEGEPEPPVPVYKGLTFRNCGLGARERTVRGGGTGPLQIYSLWDTWGRNPTLARPSEALTQ